MQCWRITKYDPRFRDESGHYLRDEWIGASQIGKAFAGEILTTDEYLRVEGLYAAAVIHLWRAAGAPSLQIQALEGATSFGLPPQSDDLLDVGFGDWFPVNGEPVPPDLLEAMVRWCLRGLGWCRLLADELHVHFGHDFYMYVGTRDATSAAREAIASTGMFVELCASPHAEAPIRGFRVLSSRIDSDVVDDEAGLHELDAAAIADLWPPVRALAGYQHRSIDPELAARIRRYSNLTFDFDRFTYTLEIDGDAWN